MTIDNNILTLEATIPNRWEDLTLDQLLAYLTWADSQDKKQIDGLSILTGIEPDILVKMPFAQVKEIESKLPDITDFPDLASDKPPKTITIEGKKVDVPTQPENMAFGAWENIKQLVRQETETRELMPYVIAHLMYENYSGQKYNEDLAGNLVSIVKGLPGVTVYPAGSFFLTRFGVIPLFGLNVWRAVTRAWKKRRVRRIWKSSA